MGNYLLALGVLILSVLIYLKLAVKYKIIDRPNERSSHKKNTVRGGGIVFLFGLLMYFVLSDFQYPYFVLGTLLVAIVSFIDDIVTLSAKIRWPFQFIAVTLMFYQVGLENFPIWTYFPLLLLALGFVNFFNFMDGINGITGLSSLVVLAGFYYLNQTHPVVDDSFLIILVISVLIFGYFNFRKKAVMFAGDIGSITMGMILFFLGVKYVIATQSALVFGLYMIFGADSTLTIFYRIYKREKLSDAHRQHLYQKLVDNFKLSHLQVSLYYAVMQVVSSVITFYLIYNIEVKYHFIILVVMFQILIAIYIYLFRKNEKKLQ